MKTAQNILFKKEEALHISDKGSLYHFNQVIEAMEEYKDQAVKEAVKVALQVATTKFDLSSNHYAILSCEEEVLKQLNIK